jgi:hypothetical protein
MEVKGCFSKAIFYGTGSYPLPPPGRHLKILLMASQQPLNKPYFLNAWIAYWEHVGVNLHFGPITGEITY